jgi:hypothetical protein
VLFFVNSRVLKDEVLDFVGSFGSKCPSQFSQKVILGNEAARILKAFQVQSDITRRINLL